MRLFNSLHGPYCGTSLQDVGDGNARVLEYIDKNGIRKKKKKWGDMIEKRICWAEWKISCEVNKFSTTFE